MAKEHPYTKWNFILTVLGFIGSLGFYFGMLKEVEPKQGTSTEIQQLQLRNRELEEELQKCADTTKSASMNSTNEQAYINFVCDSLQLKQKNNRLQLEKAAAKVGIFDKTLIKELTEYAIVKTARAVAGGHRTPREKYDRIVDLYHHQANQSYRTSLSIILRQYSTPAPIGYLMGLYCGINDGRSTVFEPSAGNGLLTIAGTPQLTTVNEIDAVRRSNLERLPFHRIMGRDAGKPFTVYAKSFDAVLANPPFASLGRGKAVEVDGYRIHDLDHYMALIALATMKDTGRAAIIVGGHSSYDELGRITSPKDRIFFNYLYHHYEVEDVVPIDGKKLYSRQGTAFNTRLILISGRKAVPQGNAPLVAADRRGAVSTFDELYNRIMRPQKVNRLDELKERARLLSARLNQSTLDGVYQPSSQGKSLQINVPDSMDFETHQALRRITDLVGGDMDNFVRHRLGYPTKSRLYDALAAEQIDAVGMAIYNIEALGQGIVVGDQTGIGKGRSAAAIIRYASQQGLKPVFITEKANLFSDIYRDLNAIGSSDLKPFIVNSRESKTDVKDEDGLVVYQAPLAIEQNRVFEKGDLSGYDYVLTTYSQFSSMEKSSHKRGFLREISKGNILILDESHNASGSSSTGSFMQEIVREAKGVEFLSATFAKRPDNMPLYAMKTVISEASMSDFDLVEAISQGGVALQEILASQLVDQGQMIRRERSYEGIEVNYIALEDYAQSHKAIADNITSILRDIIAFQTNFVDRRVSELDEEMAESGGEANVKQGTQKGGVDNLPYFSKVFNVINQMLFSIKAEAVADRAIMRLKEGKKPVIAFSSTMGSFLEQMQTDEGWSVEIGDHVSTDFAIVLERGLQGVLRYTVTNPNGTKESSSFDVYELGIEAVQEYNRISDKIQVVSTGITISPIDVIIEKIQAAGYSIEEVTGRKLKVQFNEKRNRGVIQTRKKVNTNDAFRRFNNNEVDVLLINQSGSTGASAHAVATVKVPESEVKQRVMIVVQPELDINTEIQKRGRINRTGQLIKPIYDYLNSAIPAELRLMMMLQKKLKSLDANTSSNQKQSSKILEVPDFLNKYGDQVVTDFLRESPDVDEALGSPLPLGSDQSTMDDAALKVSGRVAVLSTTDQEKFYNVIRDRYETLVAYLKQTGEYDLEVEEMNLQAETKSEIIVKMGRGGFSSFGEDSILEKMEVNILRKPYNTEELGNIVSQSLGGDSPDQIQYGLLSGYRQRRTEMLEAEKASVAEKYERIILNVPGERAINRIREATPELADSAIAERIAELESERNKVIEKLESQAAVKWRYIEQLFEDFRIGAAFSYLQPSFEGTPVETLAVFVGFKMDMNRSNPYAPSNINLRFAMASSQRYLEIPASMTDRVSSLIGASRDINHLSFEEVLARWDEAISMDHKERGTRYMITGNILQAFSSFSGKLVSFTTLDGKVRKGILLPEYWNPAKVLGGRIEVPIGMAVKIIEAMVNGSDLVTSNGITFFRRGDMRFQILIPASLSDGGAYFLNRELLKLVEGENFEKVNKSMTTYLHSDNMGAFVGQLDKLGVTISLEKGLVEQVGLVKLPAKEPARIAAPPTESQGEQLRIMQLRAKALQLKLQLLNFNRKAS